MSRGTTSTRPLARRFEALIARRIGVRIFAILWLFIAQALTAVAGEGKEAEKAWFLDIPQTKAERAIKMLSRQTGSPVIFQSADVVDVETNPLKGRYTLSQALAVLFKGTALSAGLTRREVITISHDSNSMIGENDMSAKSHIVRSKKSILAAAIGFLSGVAGAQDTLDAKQSNAIALEEIIVTATKRETSLQDTAMAISVLDGSTIEKRGLASMVDYLSTVPGVTMQDRGPGQNSIIIRGIASSPQSETEAVGAYFGEAPISRLAGPGNGGGSGSGDFRMVDINRVEVLRGPQGTLYGSGSMGGTVRIIPNAPNLNEFESRLAATYSQTDGKGSDNTMFQGVINLPIIEDQLAVRAVAYNYDNSGYYENVAADDAQRFIDMGTPDAVLVNRDDIGANKTVGARISALWTPTDNLDITLTYADQATDQNGWPEESLFLGDFQQSRAATGDAGVDSERLEHDIDMTNLMVEYDLGWGSLLSSSSWIGSQGFSDFDLAIWLGLNVGNSARTDYDVFAQELRFASDFDGPLQLIAGAYYEEIERDGFLGYIWSATSSDPFNGLSYALSERVDEQTAVFGELSYDLTDQLTAKLGARYYDFEQRTSQVTTGALLGDSSRALDTTDDGTNFSFNLSYNINEDLMAYFQWAEGFRLGKAQVPKPASCNHPTVPNAYIGLDGSAVPVADVESDNLESFELGFKGAFADGRVNMSATVYRINWEGIPVAVALDCGNQTTVVNAGESISEGIELESQVLLMDSLVLDLRASYNDSHLSEDSATLGNKGDNLPGSADYNASVGLEYGFVVSRYDAFARVDYEYVGEYYNNLQETGDPAGDYTQINLKAGVNLGQFDVDLFVKNLTDADDYTWFATGWPAGNRLRPRTMGLNVSYQF